VVKSSDTHNFGPQVTEHWPYRA